MHSLRSPAAVIDPPISSPQKSCRSSASRQTPTAPEQGRSGGAVVNVVTKSGTNHLHGTAFYYLRDSSFGASLPFLAFKPHNRQQQFGGTIGGPLKPNKIFFFAGFDQHIFHLPNVVEFLDGSSKVVPQPRTGPYTPGDYEATDQAMVFAAAAQLTSLAGEYPARLKSATLPMPNSTSISILVTSSPCVSALPVIGDRTMYSSIRPVL